MQLKDDIRASVLKAIRANDGEPMMDSALREYIRRRFPSVAHTEADLTMHIRFCEEHGWITGTSVELAGLVWTLSPKGTLKAAQL